MTTEYRRGIPSTAHVEAATRLGLLWEDTIRMPFTGPFLLTQTLPNSSLPNSSFRPIRPIRFDGMPVDWEVLDQEVARVGQQGQPATVTPTASTAPTTQPQGFRADLWAQINRHFTLERVSALTEIQSIDSVCIRTRNWQWGWGTADRETPTQQQRADILARWTVYQELKPLYDLVDGAQGEVAMPRDVVRAWWDRAPPTDCGNDHCPWSLRREDLGLVAQGPYRIHAGNARNAPLSNALANFATVLDAVAERRVAERMRGQAPAPTVTPVQSAQPEPRRFADVRPDRHGWRWWRVISWTNGDVEIQPNEWRWHRGGAEWHPWGWGYTMDTWMSQTVIPTDERGNPVSWEAIAPAGTVQSVNSDGTVTVRLNDDGSVSPAREGEAGAIRARWAVPEGFYMPVPSTSFFSTEPPTPPRPGQFSNNPATPPLTPEGFQQVLETVRVGTVPYQETLDRATRQVLTGPAIGIDTAKASPITTLPLPLPRFTVDELDDVDHSKTTKLDEITLRRGKLPTVEQIAKYRVVRARRTGGAVADALKESRIDCEVAQYVLERWAGGLGDADTVLLLRAAGCIVPLKDAPQHSIRAFDPKQGEVDRRSQDFLRTHNTTLDTSEKPSPTAQRERQEAEERRQRLAELRQRLAAERAAQAQETAKEGEVSRFGLIEPDPQADPAVSIRAWEARQAAAKVRPVAVPPRIVKPATAPRRPAIEVVDADVDGLSRSEVVAALFGRALNGGC